MNNKIILIITGVLLALVHAACNTTNSILQETIKADKTRADITIPIETAIATISPTLPVTMTLTPLTLPSPTPIPTMKPIAGLPSARSPVFHDLPGALYETLFSVPAGKLGTLKYKIPSCCTNIEGPNAIAVLSDNSFLISDLLGRRLLKYDREGRLQQTIKMVELGIGYVRDLRVKGDEIFLLETTYQNFYVRRLTLDGKLIVSEKIPYQFPIDAQKPENTLEGGLTGIATDCVERIILEVFGGSKLFPLSDVQKQNDPSLITQGLICNGKRFLVSTPGLWEDPQVTADETIYQTKLSEGLGGLQFLDVFEDGSIYLVRNDVMPINPIKVDQTIHFIDENGAIQGVARVPLSEYYFPITRNTAVNSNGDVFALLPRPGSLDVILLNFYRELEPLTPGAVVPQITIMQ